MPLMINIYRNTKHHAERKSRSVNTALTQVCIKIFACQIVTCLSTKISFTAECMDARIRPGNDELLPVISSGSYCIVFTHKECTMLLMKTYGRIDKLPTDCY